MMTAGPKSGDEARQQRRQAFVDAAVDLVRREGPMVSMEQIAAACGVTKPIVYRLFGDRDELVMEMAERFVDQLIDALAPLLTAEAPPLELLVGTMDAYLGLVERDTNLYRFLSAHAGADRRDLLAALIAEQVATVLERLLADRDLPTRPARTWAFGLVGMVHFAGDWWAAGTEVASDDPRFPADRAELVQHLGRLLWFGADGVGFGEAPPRPPLDLTRLRAHPPPGPTTSPTLPDSR